MQPAGKLRTNTHANFGVDVPIIQLLVEDEENSIWKR